MIITRNDFGINTNRFLFKETQNDHPVSGMENRDLPNTEELGGTQYPGGYEAVVGQNVQSAMGYQTPPKILNPDGRSIDLSATY